MIAGALALLGLAWLAYISVAGAWPTLLPFLLVIPWMVQWGLKWIRNDTSGE